MRRFHDRLPRVTWHAGTVNLSGPIEIDIQAAAISTLLAEISTMTCRPVPAGTPFEVRGLGGAIMPVVHFAALWRSLWLMTVAIDRGKPLPRSRQVS